MMSQGDVNRCEAILWGLGVETVITSSSNSKGLKEWHVVAEFEFGIVRGNLEGPLDLVTNAIEGISMDRLRVLKGTN